MPLTSSFFGRTFRAIALTAMLSPFVLSRGEVLGAPAEPTLPKRCGAIPSGVIALAPLQRPADSLVVVDPETGAKVGTITAVSMTDVLDTVSPSKLLVKDADGLVVVDPSALSRANVDIPAEIAGQLGPSPMLSRGSASHRYQVVGHGDQSMVYLIDLDTGDAIDVGALVPVPSGGRAIVSQVIVASDDQTALVWDGQHVYSFDLDGPIELVEVGGDAFTYAPAFAPDGKEFVYGRVPAAGRSEILLQRFTAEEPLLVASDDRVIVPLWVPNRRALLLDHRSQTDGTGSLGLLDLDTGIEQPLLSYTGAILSVQLSPDGARALVGVDKAGGRDWYGIDLETAETQVIEEAENLAAFPGLYAESRWATMTPSEASGQGVDEAPYGTLDLASGSFVTLLRQSADDIYQVPSLSDSGNAALLSIQSINESRLWLLDNERATARELGSGDSVAGALSPDGCYVAVTTFPADGAPGLTTIEPVGGGTPTSLDESGVPFWGGETA